MKIWIVLTLTGAISMASLHALPDRIGFLFDGANSPAPLENSALSQAVWSGDEELAGQWKALSEKNGIATFVLVNPAIVFGVMADQVRADRESETLTAIKIGFSPGEQVAADSQDELIAMLQNNIESFTGISPEVSDSDSKESRFGLEDFIITLTPGFADAVEVLIVPASPKTVAQEN
ncbi:MAG: hypothetical protein AAGD22_15995 [Verrucomicrobiota bacterium]